MAAEIAAAMAVQIAGVASTCRSRCRSECERWWDVLSRGLIADTAHGEWTLVVELDEHGGAVDAILKDAGCVGAHDPCKVGSVEIQCSKLDHLLLLELRQHRGANSRTMLSLNATLSARFDCDYN